MAGYSGTPLIKKLGVKENFNVAFVNAPAGYVKALELPSTVIVSSRSKKPLDFVQLFVQTRHELEHKFPQYCAKLNPSAMFWISWPKKSSGVATDLTEDAIRAIGLANGMVDVKVCAVDDIWSGLKFVFRLQDRPKLRFRP
jgi:hypothetical protein